MKTLSILFCLFFSSVSFADCGYDFGSGPEGVAVCDAINLNRVKNFFYVEETAYTNLAKAADFEVTSLIERSENEVNVVMDILFAVTYIDSWMPGQEPSLELDSCDVYLTKSYEHDGWEFEYAACENFGEFESSYE